MLIVMVQSDKLSAIETPKVSRDQEFQTKLIMRQPDISAACPILYSSQYITNTGRSSAFHSWMKF